MSTPLQLGAIELRQQQNRANVFPQTADHPEKLSHTRIIISQSNINPSDPLVSDKIYSGFLEHLGRCIYGGIVDSPTHPASEKLLIPQDQSKGDSGAVTKGRLGFRKDVIDVIGGKGELEVPIFRWPGGKSYLTVKHYTPA